MVNIKVVDHEPPDKAVKDSEVPLDIIVSDNGENKKNSERQSVSYD